MLNEQQQQAVDSNAKKILVLAGAGTGKSTVLLSRIARLLNDGVNPSGILALTFTNAAAFEMDERYRKSNQGRALPVFGTFHSFCYRLIAKDAEVRQAIGYSQTPKLAEESLIKRLEVLTKQQLGTKLSNAKLDGKSSLTAKEKFEFDLYWKQYRKILKNENSITFDIMCYDICELFSSNHPSIEKYKNRYTHMPWLYTKVGLTPLRLGIIRMVLPTTGYRLFAI
jgi:DNA helicase-2/ATP-dependent DNA helicase PcrA